MTSQVDDQSSSDAVGIHFGTDRLAGCRASQSIWGGLRYQHASVEIVDGDLSAAINELINRLGGHRKAFPIAAAIPTDECYFATRPIASGGSAASPRALLRESLRSPMARLDQMAIDVIHWQPDRRHVAGICAAPNERVEAIREAIAETDHSLQRIEPAASSLIGVSPQHEGRERRSQLTTRVILGESSLLAVMSRGGKPIHWQSLPLPPGDEATGIVAAIRSLETAATPCGLDRTPASVVVHGRPELKSLIDFQWLQSSLPGNFRWVDSPTLAIDDVTRSLAHRLIDGNDESFDLVRQHREPLKLRRVVPYRELIAYFVAAAILAAVLWGRLDGLESKRILLISSAPPLIGDGTNPKTEHEKLTAKATSVSRFLDQRVLWSETLAEVTAALPPGVQILDIRGSAPMPRSIQRRTKSEPSTLTLRANAALDDDGSLPSMLNHLAEKLAQCDSVKKRFETVELVDLRRVRDQQTGVAGAEFAVVFTGKSKKRR